MQDMTVRELCQAVMPGVTYDTTVPQAWWDSEYKRTGQPPRAIWVYDSKSPICGRPVTIASLLRQYDATHKEV